jgi:uncharacterized protein DUF3829
MKILRKIVLMIPILAIGLCLLSCEDSYMMRKFKEKKIEQASPPQTPSAPVASPAPPPQVPGPTAPSAQTPTAPAPIPPADMVGSDKSLSEKLNAFIACLNRTKPRTLQSRERYLSWVDEKTGPNCKERYISYGLYTLYEDGIQKCQQAIDLGKASLPALPKLQQAAEQLTAAFTELVPLTQKASDYYEQEDYKDDQCAKGKAMHPQLMAAFQRFIDASEAMNAEITPLQREMDQKELAQLNQQGKKLQYLSKKFLVSGEMLLAQVPKQVTPAWDSAAFLQQYPQVETDFQAMQDYATAHVDEAGAVFWFNAFSGSAKDFYTQAKFLKRDLTSGTKPGAEEVNKLIEQYNRMVSDGNNLRF